MKKTWILLIFLVLSGALSAQLLPYHVDRKTILDVQKKTTGVKSMSEAKNALILETPDKGVWVFQFKGTECETLSVFFEPDQYKRFTNVLMAKYTPVDSVKDVYRCKKINDSNFYEQIAVTYMKDMNAYQLFFYKPNYGKNKNNDD